MNTQLKKKLVFVGMSGGVDSSVSALLLQQQGYTVVGVFIKVWHPDFLPCHWEQERLDAMRVAAHLGIPFLTCDAEEVYKRDVADYFIRDYREGRTPNPDVMCNTHVKFGAFLNFALAHGASYIATGHYVQKKEKDGHKKLFRGADTEKDQSYFLWNISDDALAHSLFPIGHLQKKEVREIARKAKLPTAEKNDSQGICFLGHVDIHEFLSQYLPLTEGEVLDTTGKVIGQHKGAEIYTLGQRHGFHIHSDTTHTEPYYIVAKSITDNTITVSEKKPALSAIATHINPHIDLGDTHWFILPHIGDTVHIQTRYRQKPLVARIESVGVDGVRLAPTTKEGGAETYAPGQSCVLYVEDCLIGGGMIQATHNTHEHSS